MARADEPAFPPHPDRNYASNKNECGLSIREWYAGQALAAIMANPSWNTVNMRQSGVSDEKAFRVAARLCFDYADAMIAESQKK